MYVVDDLFKSDLFCFVLSIILLALLFVVVAWVEGDD